MQIYRNLYRIPHRTGKKTTHQPNKGKLNSWSLKSYPSLKVCITHRTLTKMRHYVKHDSTHPEHTKCIQSSCMGGRVGAQEGRGFSTLGGCQGQFHYARPTQRKIQACRGRRGFNHRSRDVDSLSDNKRRRHLAHTQMGVGQCGAQPIISEQFETGMGSPRGLDS